jgi:hypothetical protein
MHAIQKAYLDSCAAPASILRCSISLAAWRRIRTMMMPSRVAIEIRLTSTEAASIACKRGSKFLVAALRTGNTERLFQRHVGIGGAGCTIKSTKQVGTAERYNSGHERSSRSTTLPQSRVNLDKSTHSIDGETQMGNANGQANGS